LTILYNYDIIKYKNDIKTNRNDVEISLIK